MQSYGLYPIPEPSTVKSSVQYLFTAIHSIELSPCCMEIPRKAKRTAVIADTDDVCVHMREELWDSLVQIQEKVNGIELCDSIHKNSLGM